MGRALHHVALCPADMEASVGFYRDGIGLEPLMDHEFEGDWPTLFGADSDRLRSVFLGDPAAPDAGIVELVDFGRELDGSVRSAGIRTGFLLLSFNVALGDTVDRLDGLGFSVRSRITVHGVDMAVVRDPDDVQVELIDLA